MSTHAKNAARTLVAWDAGGLWAASTANHLCVACQAALGSRRRRVRAWNVVAPPVSRNRGPD